MLGIRQKLIIGFSLVVLFMLAQVFVTTTYVKSSEDLVSQSINQDFNASIAISEIAIEGQKLRRYEKEFFIYVDNPLKRDKYAIEWQGAYKNLDNMLLKAERNRSGIWSKADISNIREWKQALHKYGRGFQQVVKGVSAGKIIGTLAANKAIQDAKNKFKVLLKGASKGGSLKLEQAQISAISIANNFEIMNYVLLIGSAAGILLVMMLLIVIPPSISRPIEVLTRAADKMSTGDLTKPVPPAGTREFKQLSDTLERMRVSQKTLIKRMRSSGTNRDAA